MVAAELLADGGTEAELLPLAGYTSVVAAGNAAGKRLAVAVAAVAVAAAAVAADKSAAAALALASVGPNAQLC